MKKHIMAILLGLGLASVSSLAQAAYPSGSNSGQKIGKFDCRQKSGADEWSVFTAGFLVLETAKDTSKPGFQKVLVFAPYKGWYLTEGEYEAPGCPHDGNGTFDWWPNMTKYGTPGWLDETWSDRPRAVLGTNGKPLQIAKSVRSLPLMYVGGCKDASCKFVFYQYTSDQLMNHWYYESLKALQINYTR